MTPSPFSTDLNPLKREAVSTSIVNLVVDYLLQNQLRPGDKLPTEHEFARALGVGRNSVREAVKMLSSLGVVEIRRGVGTFIAPAFIAPAINPLVLSLVFEQGTSEELAELRYLFEAGLAELVVKKVTPQDITNLEEANERLRLAAQAEPVDLKRVRELNIDFHRQIMAITRNPLIVKMGTAVYILYRTSSEKVAHFEPLSEYRNHQVLIEMIRKKDRDGLVRFIGRVIDWVVRLAKGMEAGPSPADEDAQG